MKVKELLNTITETHINVYKENEKGRFLWWSNTLACPMRRQDVEDLIVVSITMEDISLTLEKEKFMCIVARDENIDEKLERKISWHRLSEIATDALHGLIEDDLETAMEYFRDTIELTDEEREYFGVPMESEEEDYE